MNLPDAPIAEEGFFATHFFTVTDQEKSKDFYVRILGANAKTMEIHHDKHHGAYVTNLNAALEKHLELQKKSVEDLLRNITSVPKTFEAQSATTPSAAQTTPCTGPSGRPRGRTEECPQMPG